jgi:hypothetical protein
MLPAPIDVRGHRQALKDHVLGELKERLSLQGISGRDLWVSLGYCEDQYVTLVVDASMVGDVTYDILEGMCNELQAALEAAGHEVDIILR